MLRLVFASDLHGKWNDPRIMWPWGDVLCIPGDLLGNRSPVGSHAEAMLQLDELREFILFAKKRYPGVVIVPGNHDFVFERDPGGARELCRSLGADLLIEGEVTIGGLKFYGAPHQPWFFDWAFNFPKDPVLGALAAKETWARIPNDTNILITHGPPYGILDSTIDGRQVGCPVLFERLTELNSLFLHAFGHIHESAGVVEVDNKTFVNAAILDLQYTLAKQPTVIDISESHPLWRR